MELSSDLGMMAELTKDLLPPKPELLSGCPESTVVPVLTYPRDEDILRRTAEPVEDFDDALRNLVGSLAMTMYANDAIGIAAPQVGWPLQIFVIDLLSQAPPQRGRPVSQLLIAINPIVWVLPGKTNQGTEGCLSFPGAAGKVARPASVTMRAYGLDGAPYALGCSANLARAIQHEYDHIQGTLLIDRMEAKEAQRLKRRMWASSTKH